MMGTREALGLGALLFTLAGSGCLKDPDPNEFYPCPDAKESTVVAGSMLCECVAQTDGGVAYYANGSATCESCDAVAAAGRFCICDSRNIISSVRSECVQCPERCASLECVPEPCEGRCQRPPCAPGSYCTPEGRCAACAPGRCGGACGDCPMGLTCVIGQCVAVTRCCVGKRICDEAPTGCVWSGIHPPGAPCFCDYDDSNPNLYNAFEPDAPNGRPRTEDGLVCVQRLSGTFCPF
ncbi:hypothetical protein WA016_06748 [Myxococcus stipitatus]